MARLWIVAVAALVLVAAVRLTRREGEQAPRAHWGASETREVSLPATVAESTPEAAAPAVPEAGGPAAPTQDACQDVREALRSQDAPRIDASLDRLMGWVGGDVRRALEVVALLSRETDPTLLDMVADALSQDPKIGEAREVLEAFLDMALRDALPARRIAGLTFLGERPRDPSLVATFLSIVSRDVDPDVRVAAVFAIRRQVDLAADRRAPLNDALLRAAASGETDVRASAVEALSLRDADDLQVASVAGFLGDAEPMVRITAAEKLGEAGPGQRVAALRALEEAYLHDADDRVRSMVLAALVRAGGAEAVPALRRIAGKHAALDPVVARLTATLSAGGTDVDAALDEAFGPE